MSGKKKAIIDVLLCGLYMAVLRMPTIFLIGYAEYKWLRDSTGIFLLVFPAFFSVISGYALISERMWQATVKWVVSLLLSFGMLPLLQMAYGNFDYTGYHVGFTLLIMAMFMVISDFCAGVLGSGPPPKSAGWARIFPWEKNKMRIYPQETPKFQKLSERTEKIQKRVCPIICAVIAVLSIAAICTIRLG